MFTQVFKKSVSQAAAGENIGALIRGVKLQSVQKGMVLVQAGAFEPTNCFKAKYYLLSRNEGGRSKPITKG